MRAIEFLRESPQTTVIAYNDRRQYARILSLITNNEHAIAWYREAGGEPLYRGTDNKDLAIRDIAAFARDPRKNRVPRDTSELAHTIYQKAINMAGGTANRHNSFFCTAGIKEAMGYSRGLDQAWVLFPLEDYSYTWHVEADDWTYSLDDKILEAKMNHINEMIDELTTKVSKLSDDLEELYYQIEETEDSSETTYLQIEASQIAREIENYKNDLFILHHEPEESEYYEESLVIEDAAIEISDGVVVNDRLKEAINNFHEIMLHSSLVLHVDYKVYGDIKDELNDELESYL